MPLLLCFEAQQIGEAAHAIPFGGGTSEQTEIGLGRVGAQQFGERGLDGAVAQGTAAAPLGMSRPITGCGRAIRMRSSATIAKARAW